MAKWFIEIRVVGANTDEWLRYQAVDCGWLPNNEERLQLLSTARGKFFERYGHNHANSELAVMPWLPTDGNPPDWRELAAVSGEAENP